MKNIIKYGYMATSTVITILFVIGVVISDKEELKSDFKMFDLKKAE